MFFLIGFILGMAGLGLMVAGAVPWTGGRKLPARTARQVGGVLISSFPLMLVVRLMVSGYEADYDIDVNAFYGTVAALCLIAAGIVLFRGAPTTGRKAAARPAAMPTFDATETPFDVEPVAMPLPSPRQPKAPPGPKKKGAPAPKEKNPFDFG